MRSDADYIETLVAAGTRLTTARQSGQTHASLAEIMTSFANMTGDPLKLKIDAGVAEEMRNRVKEKRHDSKRVSIAEMYDDLGTVAWNARELDVENVAHENRALTSRLRLLSSIQREDHREGLDFYSQARHNRDP